MLILNLDLDFSNSDPKIHFSANLGSKTQVCPFCLKIGGHFKDVDSECRLRFLKFHLHNPFLGEFRPKNSNLSVVSENWCTEYLTVADFESTVRFLSS